MSESDPSLAARDELENPPAPATSRGGWERLGPLLSKVALELFIVFIGVSAAFAVEDYRDQREENERRQAIYRALDRELKQMAETHGPVFQRQMTQQLTAWDQAVASGKRPLPQPFAYQAPRDRPPASGTRPPPREASSWLSPNYSTS